MRLRKIGIIEPEGSKWEYQCVKFVIWITFFEIGFALFDSFAIVNSYIAWKNHILKGKPKKHRAYKKYRAGSPFGVDRKMGQACYASLQGTTASCKKKRRRLVLSLQKTVVIQSYHWAQSESHTAGVKAPWWAHRATIQVGVKLCNAGNLPSGTVGAVQRILVVCFQFALRACGHATRSFTELVGRSSSICLQNMYA